MSPTRPIMKNCPKPARLRFRRRAEQGEGAEHAGGDHERGCHRLARVGEQDDRQRDPFSAE